MENVISLLVLVLFFVARGVMKKKMQKKEDKREEIPSRPIKSPMIQRNFSLPPTFLEKTSSVFLPEPKKEKKKHKLIESKNSLRKAFILSEILKRRDGL